MANNYYVYIYFRLTGIPCYVGKGKGERWTHHRKWSCNRRLARIMAKAGGDLPVVFIRRGMTEAEAFEMEIAFIAAIGRADLGLGPLVNFTNGGDGKSGAIVSQETRNKMKGRKPNLGKPTSPEVRAKISAAMRGKKNCVGFKRSAETRAKMSAALVGNKRSLGYFPSAETRAKLSAARLGNKIMLGKKLSAETRARMSAAQRKRYASGDSGGSGSG